MNKVKECPFCGVKLTLRGNYYEHPSCDCLLDCYSVHKTFVDKWNTRKPIERIVEQLKENTLTTSSWDECVDLEDAIDIVRGE